MKFEIEPPVERMVTLRMTLREAKVLADFAPNLYPHLIESMGGGTDYAYEVTRVMQNIFQSFDKLKESESHTG